MTDIVTQRFSEFLIASTSFLATPIERNWDPITAVEWTRRNWTFAIVCVVLYMAFIFGVPLLLTDRKPFDLRLPLAGWNALLCVFSFIGMCRTMPYLMGYLMTHNFEDSVCTSPLEGWGRGPTGFWVMLFIYSKIPELIDTVFIVLRKKPLIFLHWYHHVTVLLFCWSAFSSMAGSGLYFVAMNYTVHALMYGYYCLQALNVCPKSFPAILITLSQISQMLIGTGVCAAGWVYLLFPRLRSSSSSPCANDVSNLIAGGLMYGSYLYLFVDFAVRRYSHASHKPVKRMAGGVKKLD